MDLSKVSPAPWRAVGECVEGPVESDGTRMMIYDEGGHNDDEAEFIALARNAFDVMMRRGWTATLVKDEKSGAKFTDLKWRVWTDLGWLDGHPDPFTALVEADQWYKQNVENKK